MSLPLCKLCKIKIADKTNSHIVPKFLTKNLFPSAGHHRTIQIDKYGKSREPQDTPKEDYIVCSDCEKRIAVVETTFSKIIKSLHTYKEFPKKFKHIIFGEKEYLECLEINPILFKLFFYSIIWRLSISSNPVFKTLSLPLHIEEELRLFLNTMLHTKFEELNKNIKAVKYIPEYHLCVIKPKIYENPSGGIFSAYSSNDKLEHFIFLVDFLLLFIIDENLLNPLLHEYSNKQSNMVIIGLGDNKLWFNFSKNIVYKMLTQNSGL